MKTDYPRSAFLILGGILAAAQVGKAIVAMPLIQRDLGLDLSGVSLILAIFAGLGALFGMGAGVLARRAGTPRALPSGMFLMAAGSLLGGFGQGETALILSRLIEGLGFLTAVVGIPDLLSRLIAPRDRDLMFGIWASYLPTGSVLMMLCGPALPFIGWRNFWIGHAAALVAYGLSAFFLLRGEKAPEGGPAAFRARDALAVLRSPSCLLLALGFASYTFQYFAFAGFMPVLLVNQLGSSIGSASILTAIAIAANAAGNIAAGVLSRLGVPLWMNVMLAFAGYALAAPLVFSAGLPAGWVAALITLALGLSGLAPGSIFAAIPRFAPRADLVSPLTGLIQQASALGQFAGPLVVGLLVSQTAWSWAPLATIPVAMAGLAVAFAIRRRL